MLPGRLVTDSPLTIYFYSLAFSLQHGAVENNLFILRSDAQRAAKQKERKEKELELCAFNAEQIEDSSHTHSLVTFIRDFYYICRFST